MSLIAIDIIAWGDILGFFIFREKAMSSSSTDDKDLELEIKYLLPDLAALRTAWDNFAALAGDVLRERDYRTVFHYFDTDAFDLLNSGTILRKMDASLPHFLAQMDVKTLGTPSADGVLDRKEFGYPLAVDAFDLAAITDPEAQDLLAPMQGKTLKEYFFNVNERRDLCAAFNSKARKAALEISVEQTDYYDAGNGKLLRTTFELEVEFKQKFSDKTIDKDDAMALIVDTGKTITAGISGAVLSTKSKAETGFNLCCPKTSI